MNKYVITGASGHIGNNLVRHINEAEPDSTVVALTRRSVDAELKGTRCTQIVGDIGKRDFLDANIGEGDIVIHLAGLIDLTDKMPTETDRTNNLGTRLICDVCREKRVKRFLYFGSVDGIAKGSEAVISDPKNYFPDGVEGNYGKSKARAAQYVTEVINSDPGFNAAIILPSAVIGRNDFKPSAVGRVIADIVKGRAEFGIRGGYSFVDVRDVCSAALALCHSEHRGSFIVSGHSITVKQLFISANKLLGIRRRPIIIPLPLVRLFMPFIKVLNPITLKALTENHNYSCERAELLLGYSPRPFEETLSDTVDWFKSTVK